MSPKQYQQLLQQFLQRFQSASIVNGDGSLLGSVDSETDLLTTTRLVAFQIIKKYLAPKPLDLFIMNDPENGGFSYSKIIFVTALDRDLYLIWSKSCSLINFKIPPTPIYEKNRKNQFVWSALVDAHPASTELALFLEKQKILIDQLILQIELVRALSQVKNQNIWLKSTQEIFDQQLQSKAFGNFESSFKTNNNQLIKLKTQIEDRQTTRLITFDLSSTSPAAEYHAASHIIESALIHQIIRFYQITEYLSQSVLDKIKTILPPKSIVSKAHPTGLHNREIQLLCSQLAAYNLQQLNSQSRKPTGQFEAETEFYMEFNFTHHPITVELHAQQIHIRGLEEAIERKQIELLKLQKTDHQFALSFKILAASDEAVQIKTNLGPRNKEPSVTLNNKNMQKGLHPLNVSDTLELSINF